VGVCASRTWRLPVGVTAAFSRLSALLRVWVRRVDLEADRVVVTATLCCPRLA